LDQFYKEFGVTPEMIFNLLNVHGIEDVGVEQLVTLSGLITALRDGDTSVEQAFSSASETRKSDAARNATDQRAKDIANKYAKPAEHGPGEDSGWQPRDEENPSTAPENTQAHTSAPQQGEPSHRTVKPSGRRGTQPQGVPIDFGK